MMVVVVGVLLLMGMPIEGYNIIASTTKHGVPSSASGITAPSTATSSSSSAPCISAGPTRRGFFVQAAATAAAAAGTLPMVTSPQASMAASDMVATTAVTGSADGNLPDLPPEAVRSYLQYRIALQTSADFYLFELRDKLADVQNWYSILHGQTVSMTALTLMCELQMHADFSCFYLLSLFCNFLDVDFCHYLRAIM
jgi:hypothetical protein